MAEHYSIVSSNENYSEDFNRHRQRIEQEFDFDNNVRDAAPGEDLITYSMIKNLHETALRELHQIMQMIWTNGDFIDDWRKSVILSFHKSGKDPTERTSYRPISLTCTIGKLM